MGSLYFKERSEASSGRALAKSWCLGKPRSRQVPFSPDSEMGNEKTLPAIRTRVDTTTVQL